MMYAWEAAQQAVNYIEEHLREDLSNEMLAGLVSLSPFYFQRLFKRLVRKPVQEYIKLRRLARVTEDLDKEDKRILDIALDYGFSSHANFTRAFKEAYGITPEDYKKKKLRLNTFNKPEIAMNYIMVDEGYPLIVGDIVLEINRKSLPAPVCYLGLSGEVSIAAQAPAGEQTGIDVPGQLWDQFHARKEKLKELFDSSEELGMSYGADPEHGAFRYFTGGLCKNGSIKPLSGLETHELPAGDYIVCRIEADSFEYLVTDALDTANRYLYETWLTRHELITEPFAAEKYFTEGEDSVSMEIWVKLVSDGKNE